ncbi:MAG: SirB2 family protein [Methylovulum sp.]
MIKIFHLTLVVITIFSFVGRVILSETHPQFLKRKSLVIAPHVIDTLLLVSGIILVFQGQWLSADYGWLIAKIVALIGYIGLAVVVMRSRGTVRWLAFVGAMICFVYIGIVAVTKNPVFFL